MMALPEPGTMVALSSTFQPPVLRGITVYPNEPFKFEFIVDSGESKLNEEELKAESDKLIKYFLAALTTPEEDLWVNLSPYEKEKIIPEEFSTTEMGRDLLGQDYILKQLTASLIYPEDDLGSAFWDRIYEKANELYGTTQIPVNTFNKVWIVPEKAIVYEDDTSAFITESRLKVMLEEDYVALSNQRDKAESRAPARDLGLDQLRKEDVELISDVSSAIVKEIILPEIEREVNTGKNFAPLRQIYHSLILAAWFKRNLKQSVLGQIYMDQNKVDGIDLAEKEAKQKIYNQYIEAFKKGVYDYIREDYDPAADELIPRKYFAGGTHLGDMVDNPDKLEGRDKRTDIGRRGFSAGLLALLSGASSFFKVGGNYNTKGMSRRDFLRGAGAGAAAVAMPRTTLAGIEQITREPDVKATVDEFFKKLKETYNPDKALRARIIEYGVKAIPYLTEGLGEREWTAWNAAVNILYQIGQSASLDDGIRQELILALLDSKKNPTEYDFSDVTSLLHTAYVIAAKMGDEAATFKAGVFSMAQLQAAGMGMKELTSGYTKLVDITAYLGSDLKDKDKAVELLLKMLSHDERLDRVYAAQALKWIKWDHQNGATKQRIAYYIAVGEIESLAKMGGRESVTALIDVAKENMHRYQIEAFENFGLAAQTAQSESWEREQLMIGAVEAIKGAEFVDTFAWQSASRTYAALDINGDLAAKKHFLKFVDELMETDIGGARSILEKVDKFLPETHPHKGIFTSIANRYEEYMKGYLAFSDLFTVLTNSDFLAMIDTKHPDFIMDADNRVSFAKATINLLKRLDLSVDDLTKTARDGQKTYGRAVMEFLFDVRRDFLNWTFLDKDTHVVIISHEDSRQFNEKEIEDFVHQFGAFDVTIIKGFGPNGENRQKVLDAIEKSPPRTLFWVDTHGGVNHPISLAFPRLTPDLLKGRKIEDLTPEEMIKILEQMSNNMGLGKEAFSYQELSDALEKRYAYLKKQNPDMEPDLSQTKFFFNSCLAFGPLVKALNLTHKNKNIKVPPVAVTASAQGMPAYTINVGRSPSSVFIKSLERVMYREIEPYEALTGWHIARAEEHSSNGVFVHEDISPAMSLFPDRQEEFAALKRNLGVKPTDKDDNTYIRLGLLHPDVASVALIGNQGEVVGVDGTVLQVRDNVTGDVSPVETDAYEGDSLADILNPLKGLLTSESQRHSDLLNKLIAHLVTHAGQAQLRTFAHAKQVADVEGSALVVQNMIVLLKDLAHNRNQGVRGLAFLHESGEFVGDGSFDAANRLTLEFAGDAESGQGAIRVILGGNLIGEVALTRTDTRDIIAGRTTEHHYLLRALQRELFGELDRQFTETIGQLSKNRTSFAPLGPSELEEYKEDDFEAVMDTSRIGFNITLRRGNELTQAQQNLTERLWHDVDLYYSRFDEVIITSDPTLTNGGLLGIERDGERHILYIHLSALDRLSKLPGDLRRPYMNYLIAAREYASSFTILWSGIGARQRILDHLNRRDNKDQRASVIQVAGAESAEVFGVTPDAALVAALQVNTRDVEDKLEGADDVQVREILEQKVRPYYQFVLGEDFDALWPSIVGLISDSYQNFFVREFIFELIPHALSLLDGSQRLDLWQRIVDDALWSDGLQRVDERLVPSDVMSYSFMKEFQNFAHIGQIEALLALVEDCRKNQDPHWKEKWNVLKGGMLEARPSVFREGTSEVSEPDGASIRWISRIIASFIERYGFGRLQTEYRYDPYYIDFKNSSGGAAEALMFSNNWGAAMLHLQDYPHIWTRIEDLAIWAYENKVDPRYLATALGAVDRFVTPGMDVMEVAQKLQALRNIWGSEFDVLGVLNLVADWGQEIKPFSRAGMRLTQLLKADNYRDILAELFTVFLDDALLAEPFLYQGKLMDARQVADMIINDPLYHHPGNAYQLMEALAVYQIQQRPTIVDNFSEGHLHAWIRRISQMGNAQMFIDEDRKGRHGPITHVGSARSKLPLFGYLELRSDRRLNIDPSVRPNRSLQHFQGTTLDNYFEGLSGQMAIHLTLDKELFTGILERGSIINGSAQPEIAKAVDKKYGIEGHLPTNFVHFFINNIRKALIVKEGDALYRRLVGARYGFVYASEFLLENYAFLHNPLNAQSDFSVTSFQDGKRLKKTEVSLQAAIVFMPENEKQEWQEYWSEHPEQQPQRIFWYKADNIKKALVEFRQALGLNKEGRVKEELTVSRRPAPVDIVMDPGFDVHTGTRPSFKNDYLGDLSAMLLSIKDAPDTDTPPNVPHGHSGNWVDGHFQEAIEHIIFTEKDWDAAVAEVTEAIRLLREKDFEALDDSELPIADGISVTHLKLVEWVLKKIIEEGKSNDEIDQLYMLLFARNLNGLELKTALGYRPQAKIPEVLRNDPVINTFLQGADEHVTYLQDVFGRKVRNPLLEYRTRLDELRVEEKAFGEIVTEADHTSQRNILEAIWSRFPGHRVIAEETLRDDFRQKNEVNKDSPFVWVIDPLDGTSQFKAGTQEYGVPAVLFYNGHPVMGIFIAPQYKDQEGTVITAVMGKGVFVNGERVQLPLVASENNAVAYQELPENEMPHVLPADRYEALARMFGRVKTKPTSTSLDIARILLGEVRVVNHPWLKMWDSVLAAFVEIAGGTAVYLDGSNVYPIQPEVMDAASHRLPQPVVVADTRAHALESAAALRGDEDKEDSQKGTRITTPAQLEELLSARGQRQPAVINLGGRDQDVDIQVPVGIDLEEEVSDVTFVFDIDSTLATDVMGSIDQANLDQIIRAFKLFDASPQKRNVKFVLFTGAAYKPYMLSDFAKKIGEWPWDALEKQSSPELVRRIRDQINRELGADGQDPNEVGAVPLTREAIQIRGILEQINEALKQEGLGKYTQNVMLKALSGLETVTYNAASGTWDYSLNKDESKVFKEDEHLAIAKALTTSFLKQWAKKENLNFDAHIKRIEDAVSYLGADGVAGVYEIINEAIGTEDIHMFSTNFEVNIVFQSLIEKGMDGAAITREALSILREKGYVEEDRYFLAGGVNFAKIDLTTKGNELVESIEKGEIDPGAGVIVSGGDSTADSFLWADVQRMLPFYFGRRQAVADYENVILALDENANDHILAQGSGQVIRNVLDVMEAGGTWGDVRFLNNRFSPNEMIHSLDRGDGNVVYTGQRAPLQNVRAVVFDMDGVIIDTGRIYRQVFAELIYAPVFGLPLTEENLQEGREYYDQNVFGLQERDLLPGMIEASRKIDPDRRFLEVDEYVQRYWTEREARLAKILQENPEDLLIGGVSELVRELKQRGVMVLLSTSNTQEAAHSFWDRMGLFSRFDDKRAGLGLDKKMANIQAMLRERGIAPKDAVFIDDSRFSIRKAREVFGNDLFVVNLAAGDALVQGGIDAGADRVIKRNFGAQSNIQELLRSVGVQSVEAPGGIDLNPNILDMETRGQGVELNVPMDPETLRNLDIDGLVPVIINIVPITNIQNLLLGSDPNNQLNGKHLAHN